MKYRSFKDIGEKLGIHVDSIERPVVCVQGLGFVGTAMAIATAHARNKQGEPYFNVIGVDLPTREGKSKVEAINKGHLFFKCNDTKLQNAIKEARNIGNLIATHESDVYCLASVIVVDVHLDLTFKNNIPKVDFEGFRNAIKTIGEYINPGCLIIVETTVPPGTCEKVVVPELTSAMKRRGLPEDSFLLAHSYERVMPGKNYLDSIINFWRVYGGYTAKAADACDEFLSKVINVKDYPLTRLPTTTASELGKVLENSYRATNIAFVEEWGRFAEAVGVNIFEVIEGIRKRPTHCNIRTPGFGVGGYCLTKDPLLAKVAAKEFFGLDNIKFPFSTMAVETNKKMPLVSLNKIQELLGGNLKDKTILLMGISYLNDIGDTRHSPSQIFVENARSRGAKVICHDPLVDYWPELDERINSEIPSLEGVDVVVFAVPHEEYRKLEIKLWLKDYKPIVFDAFNVLTEEQRETFRKKGCHISSIGRGERL